MARGSAGDGKTIDDALAVVSVVGMPRSGSTIVSRLLGEVDGFVCVGEVRHIWWGLHRDRGKLCGCGDTLLTCPFWADVFARVGFDGSSEGIAERAAIQDGAVRRTHPWLGLPRTLAGSGHRSPAAHPFASMQLDLYRAIAAVADARVVVDSSKKSDYTAFISGLDGVDTHVVHTLRDPRGILMSHYARAHRDAPSVSHPKEAIRLSGSWLVETAAAAAVVRQRRPHATRVDYGEFASDPLGTLGPIVEALGGDPTTLPIEADGKACLSAAHTAGGSPTRFQNGPVAIKPDQRWHDLNRRDQLIARVVTSPLAPFGLRPW